MVFLSATFWILPSPSVSTVSDDGRTSTEDPFSAKAVSDLLEARLGGIRSPGHASPHFTASDENRQADKRVTVLVALIQLILLQRD